MWFGSSIELAKSLVKIEVAIELISAHRPRSLQHLLGNVFMFVSAFFFPMMKRIQETINYEFSVLDIAFPE